MSHYHATLDYSGSGSALFLKAKLLGESVFAKSFLEVS